MYPQQRRLLLIVLLLFTSAQSVRADEVREVPEWVNAYKHMATQIIPKIEIPDGISLQDASGKLCKALSISLIVGDFKGDRSKISGFTLENASAHQIMQTFATLHSTTLTYERFGVVLGGQPKKCVLLRAKTTRKITVEKWRQTWISSVGPSTQFALDADGMGFTALVPKDQGDGMFEFLDAMGIIENHVRAEIDWPIAGDPRQVSSYIREEPFAVERK